MKHVIRINKRTGTIEFLGNIPPGIKVPDAKRQRFSEIVPVHQGLRLAFRILRLLCGEQGIVGDWTRTWRCQWEAIILLGPHRGTRRVCNDRDFLLHWEKQMFMAHGAGGAA